MKIIDKLKVGDIVISNGIRFIITSQIDKNTFGYQKVEDALHTGEFQFTDDQEEDSFFFII